MSLGIAIATDGMNDNDQFLRKNMEVLAEIRPELAARLDAINVPSRFQVKPARNGRPVLIIDNISLHSRLDPEAEAKGFIGSKEVRDAVQSGALPLVFGFGLGYHITALLELFPRIAVYEPEPAIIKTALTWSDWRGVLPRMRIYTKGDDIGAISAESVRLLSHRPSQRLSPGEFARLEAMLTHGPRRSIAPGEKLRILTVSPITGGSLPAARHVSANLLAMGHEVIEADMNGLCPFYENVKENGPGDFGEQAVLSRMLDFAGEYITYLCRVHKPDLLLALAQAPLAPASLARIRADNVPTAFWFVEDYRLMQYFRELAPHYDYFFHIQGREMEKQLKKCGASNYMYLPPAADPEIFKPIIDEQLLSPFRADLSFMGAGYPNRRTIFRELTDWDLKIWGTQWDLEKPPGHLVQENGRRVTTEETVLIFNAAKINLNIHSSIYTNGLDPSGRFINPRTFEVASCGAFQLVDRRDPLERHFNIGEEIIAFNHVGELKDQIRYYLARPEEAFEIAGKARQRVLSEHTYRHRLEALLDFISSTPI